MIRIIYRPEAEADVESVFDWYEMRQAGLGQAFRAELNAAHARIVRSPTAFRVFFEEARRCLLKRFPYQLLFVLDGEDVVVLGCIHVRASDAVKEWRTQ